MMPDDDVPAHLIRACEGSPATFERRSRMSDSKQPDQTEVAAKSIDIEDLPNTGKDLDMGAEKLKGGALPERDPSHTIPIGVGRNP
jgi:hypothetical protein